jgi:hypothetical protein
VILSAFREIAIAFGMLLKAFRSLWNALRTGGIGLTSS